MNKAIINIKYLMLSLLLVAKVGWTGSLKVAYSFDENKSSQLRAVLNSEKEKNVYLRHLFLQVDQSSQQSLLIFIDDQIAQQVARFPSRIPGMVSTPHSSINLKNIPDAQINNPNYPTYIQNALREIKSHAGKPILFMRVDDNAYEGGFDKATLLHELFHVYQGNRNNHAKITSPTTAKFRELESYIMEIVAGYEDDFNIPSNFDYLINNLRGQCTVGERDIELIDIAIEEFWVTELAPLYPMIQNPGNGIPAPGKIKYSDLKNIHAFLSSM